MSEFEEQFEHEFEENRSKYSRLHPSSSNVLTERCIQTYYNILWSKMSMVLS